MESSVLKTPTILVYGWYNHLNLGDNFFIEAFEKLFPQFYFCFTDKITKLALSDFGGHPNVDAVFFGGGSFLSNDVEIEESARELLLQKPIFYIGVGLEGEIHPFHLKLMKVAKLIATRSANKEFELKQINPNTIAIPDIVYSLQDDINLDIERKEKSILFLPNISVVPKWNDPNWKHAAWNYFKSEFAQFLDILVERKYSIDMFGMCTNSDSNDNYAASEIINQMSHRSGASILDCKSKTFKDVSSLISQYDHIITQRYHGIVLSEMTNTDYLTISHHDKLSYHYTSDEKMLNYYGVNKSDLLSQGWERGSRSDDMIYSGGNYKEFRSIEFKELYMMVNNFLQH